MSNKVWKKSLENENFCEWKTILEFSQIDNVIYNLYKYICVGIKKNMKQINGNNDNGKLPYIYFRTESVIANDEMYPVLLNSTVNK